MFEFLEFIKEHIKTAFANDTQITESKKPEVYNAYKKNHEPTASSPEIQVQIMDNSESTRYTTFCGKRANSIPLQITSYTGEMSINKTKRSAQDASIIFGDKIEKILYELIYSCSNKNIYEGRIVTMSPALPMNDAGTIYTTAVRCEFTIASPYVVD